MGNVHQDQVFFESLKDHRGWYFVEYSPPIPSNPFATAQLVVLDKVKTKRVAMAMEHELASWLQRYPVPLMVSSFDGTGTLISLSGVRDCDHLIGWQDSASGKLVSHWRIVANTEFPRASWDAESLKSVYGGIAFRTSAQLKKSALKSRRLIRMGWWLVFIWGVAVPVAVATIELTAPQWLAVLVFCYSLTRAYIEALKLLGKWPKTDSDLAKEEEERRMRHHHYHCERNPEGFRRLKQENIERESREEIQREAESLKRKGGAEAD
jgi:hypothetical protein